MYPVTELFAEKIKENNRVFQCKVQIQHSQGVLDLTDKDLVLGSLLLAESSQAGDEFTVGGTVAADLSLSFLNKSEYEDIEFEGATVIPQVALLLSVGLDTENYFLSAPRPSEFEEGEGQEYWEWVPLGIFNIDDPIKLRNTIQIKAIDNMIKFDKPYSLSSLSYPATLYQIYVDACNVCDVTVGTLDFPNKNHIVQERPDRDYTFRDIIGYVAELAGCFAKCNRTGALEIRWYENTGLELGPMNRFDFKPKDYQVKIKGIMATVDDTVYLTGTDDYAIDLSDNPLLQSDYETVLPNILNHIGNTVFTPYDSRWQGNPAVMAGDLVTHTDRDGNEYATLITHSTYKYRGASTMSAKGLPERARGFKGSTNKKIAQIKRKIEKEVGNRLTTLEQAQLDATELIANMLGGYTHFESDAFYISDNPILTNSTKIWKWGIGGFGYSEDGGNTYTTAITAAGSIVAELIAAGIITADMVQTGLLQSEDGSTWINLDNGEFNFKNKFKFANGEFSVSLDDTTLATRVTEVESKVELSNTAWSARFDTTLKIKDIRYIRDWLNGTDVGGISTWSELIVLDIHNTNVATVGIKTASSSVNPSYPLSNWVDNNNNSHVRVTGTGWQYLQWDLGISTPQIAGIGVKHSGLNNKYNHRLEVSSNGIDWFSLYDSDVDGYYLEQSSPKMYYLNKLQSGITTITGNGVKVEHSAFPGQYSEMRADGFIRQWQYGESKYLNDIFMYQKFSSPVFRDTPPPTVRISLPQSFRGRGSTTKIIPVSTDFYLSGAGVSSYGEVRSIIGYHERILDIVASDFTSATPYVDVDSYVEFEDYNMWDDWDGEYGYHTAGFVLIVIGY